MTDVQPTSDGRRNKRRAPTTFLCMQAVAPQLIILRVSMGKAWTKTTATQFSTGNSMAFHTGSHHRNIGLDTFNSAKNGGGSTTVASTQASYDKYKSSNSLTNV